MQCLSCSCIVDSLQVCMVVTIDMYASSACNGGAFLSAMSQSSNCILHSLCVWAGAILLHLVHGVHALTSTVAIQSFVACSVFHASAYLDWDLFQSWPAPDILSCTCVELWHLPCPSLMPLPCCWVRLLQERASDGPCCAAPFWARRCMQNKQLSSLS